MFEKKNEFRNNLTDLISNKNPTLDQVILHDDLSHTLRNGSEILLNFLFCPENYEKIIDYALFNKETETEEFENLSIKQINNNAANILSYPNKKIKDKLSEIKDKNGKPLILQKFEEFIEDESFNRDYYYAGHFERIYENLLRDPGSHLDLFFNDEFSDKLIPFLVENILILAYKELFQILFEDLIEQIDSECLKKIMKIILQYAAFYSYVTYCKQPPNQNTLLKSYQRSLKYFNKRQPLNNSHEPVPIPDFNSIKIIEYNHKKYEDHAKKKGVKLFPSKYKSTNPNSFDLEKSQNSAYFFLSSIRIAFVNNGQNEFLEDKEFIELLLYCAVFSDSESESSAEAFKILENIYYGIFIENDFRKENTADPYEDESFYQLIDEYANYISYDNKYLTKQQVCAFPLFWNHRYPELTDEEFFVNIDPVLNMTEYHLYPKQLTPFLAFRSFLLSDPPYSSQLNYSYLKIFDFLIKKKNRLIGNDNKDLKLYDQQTQEEIRNIVFIVYEFIQRKFRFYPNDSKMNFYDTLHQIVPYFPKNSKELNNESPVRPLLNGAICEVFKMIFNSKLFIVNGKASLLLSDIEDEISTDVIQKIIEYDRRIPSSND